MNVGYPKSVDVVVVGARVAGAALATLLAKNGHSVVLVDRAERLGKILSSHVMQADSVRFFDQLGVLPEVLATGAPPFAATDTRLGDFQAVLPYRTEAGAGGGLCVRRCVLDPILLDAAVRAGVRTMLGTRVTALLTEGGRVSGVRVADGERVADIAAKLVVGADGRNSTVARLAGARKYHVTPSVRAYHWAYYAGASPASPPTFTFHRWGDQFVLGAPADSGLYLVGTSHTLDDPADPYRADLERAFHADASACAPVAAAIDGAERVGKIYGIARFAGYFREGAGPGWVLLGDAGHFKDPAAGRGIGDAFRQASALSGDLASVVDGPVGGIDAATARWAGWRDAEFVEHYWMGADLGGPGALPAILPEVVARLHATGRGARLLDVMSHDARPMRVLTPARVLGAALRLLATRPDRRATLAAVRNLAADQLRRARLVRNPVHESDPAPDRPLVGAQP